MKTKPLPDLCQYDKVECPPKGRAKKDKRRWCRGKVGVKHQVKWVVEPGYLGIVLRTLVCDMCGKQLWWFGGIWRSRDEGDSDFALRFAKAWEDAQVEAKRRFSYYLDFVE